jgi:DNA-directed RNA polymerase subunit L
MELNILEEKKGRLVFELHGADHTVANVLKDELWNDKNVTVASYAIEHPMKPVPKFIVEAADPKKALAEASKRLQKKNKDMQAAL